MYRKISLILLLTSLSASVLAFELYAPTNLKPSTNRVLNYPNSIPTFLQIRPHFVRTHQAPTQTLSSIWKPLVQRYFLQTPTIANIGNKSSPVIEGVDIRQVKNNSKTTPAQPKTVKDIQAEVYEEEHGKEEFRYGYQVKSNQTYVDHSNGETCNDGGGTISGTYCAPNGERYNVNVDSTNQAASKFNQAVVDKINELSSEEIIQLAKDSNPTIPTTCQDSTCQQHTLAQSLETVISQALIAEKKSDVQSVAESYLVNQKAQDYINLSTEELAKKYGSSELISIIPTLTSKQLQEIEDLRNKQQAIIASAKTETTESIVNGQTVYTTTITYTDPDTGKLLDTQTISYTAEASTTKEKIDEGFITHDTVVFRDTKTGKILDAKTTSYILKSTTRTYNVAPRGNPEENTKSVTVIETTARDANTNELIATTNTLIQADSNNPQLTINQQNINFSKDAVPTVTTSKTKEDNPNYISPVVVKEPIPQNPTIFSKQIGETCATNTDCGSGLCGRASVVVKDATCQPNPNQTTPTTASPESCPANTTLSCRGTACACLTHSQITNLEQLEQASNGNLLALAASIPQNYSYKNDTNGIGNYAGANGDLNTNKFLTIADIGWNVIPTWARYRDQTYQRQWEVMNFESLEDCQVNLPTTFKNGVLNGSFLCNNVIYTNENLSAATALGTDLTEIGGTLALLPQSLAKGATVLLEPTLKTAITGTATKLALKESAALGFRAVLPSLGTYGVLSTVNQTGNTTVSCLDGSDTCARDLGYTTLSWLNLGSMEYISSAMASGVATQIRNAQIVNTTLTVANAGTDLAIANDSCFGENKTTAGCLASAGVIALDIAGGFFDLTTGQFIFQKVPNLSVNSAAIASLANNPVPPATKNALDPVVDAAKPATPPAPNFTVLKNGDVNNPLIVQELQINGVNTARINEAVISDPVLRKQAELTNALLDEFAKDIGYQPYPAQVAELLSGKTVMQLKYPDGHALAGQPIAGKTDIIARLASVGEPRSIILTKGTTEAMDYINTQMLSPGGRAFYQSQGATGIFVHNELGFLEIDFTKGSFNPNTARVMSGDEVTTLLKNNLDLPDNSRLVFVADRPQAAWTRLKGNNTVPSSLLPSLINSSPTSPHGLVVKDLLTTNTYGSALVIADEISEDIKGVFAVSGSGIPLKEVADATLLGGVKSGDQAINIFKQAVDDSPTHQEFTRARSVELNSGVGVASSLQNLGDGNFIPVDKTVYGNTLADLVDQSLKKYSHRISKLGKELADLTPALRSGDPAAIKSFEALLADAPPSSLLTDITFRKSSIQSDYNMLARVPGSDFGIEGNNLVLRKATATTGEKLSGPTDLLAFYYRGYDMTEAFNAHMIEKIDPTKPITRVELANIAISPQGSKITVTDFYQEMERAGHKLRGLDATPQEAISALYLKDAPIETKITPAHLATDTNRSGLVDQFVDRRTSQFNNNASAVVLAKTNSDMNADLLALVKKSQEKGVGYTEVIVAQYKKQPNGIEAEEYLAYPVKSNGEIDFTNRRNLGDAQGWNTAIQSKLSGDKPQELLIVYMGRERAADLKITANHDKIRWSLLFETSGGELPTEVSFEQMWRRNRIFNTDFSKSMDFDLYLTTTRTDLTPDNVQTAYFRENLNTKLANDRFTDALDGIAKSPARALEQIKALGDQKMGYLTRVRFNRLVKQLEQEVGTFENILRTGLSPDLLTGDDLYRELYARASRSNARILGMAEQVGKVLSNGDLSALKQQLRAVDSFPEYAAFRAELDRPTSEFTAPESFGPADLLMAYAKNNSTNTGAAPQFRATNERYIAPTTPTTATAPRSVDVNTPINDRITRPTSLTDTLVNLTTNPSRELTQYGEILFRNFAATLNPTSAQSRVEQAQRHLDTLLSNQNTGVYISDSEMVQAKAELQAAILSRNNGREVSVPILDNETVYDTLTRPGATIGFITKENDVIEFSNQNGVITYSENGTTPTTVSIAEALDLFPSVADIALISRNNQTFNPNDYSLTTTQPTTLFNSQTNRLTLIGLSIAEQTKTNLTRNPDGAILIKKKNINTSRIPSLKIFLDRLDALKLNMVSYATQEKNTILVVEENTESPLDQSIISKIANAQKQIRTQLGGSYDLQCSQASECAIEAGLADNSLVTLKQSDIIGSHHYIAIRQLSDGSYYAVDHTFGLYVIGVEDLPLLLHASSLPKLIEILNTTYNGNWQDFNEITGDIVRESGIEAGVLPKFQHNRQLNSWIKDQKSKIQVNAPLTFNEMRSPWQQFLDDVTGKQLGAFKNVQGLNTLYNIGEKAASLIINTKEEDVVISSNSNIAITSPTASAFEQHLSKWNQIEKDIIKPIQEEIKKPEILAERQEKYLEALFSLINQMTKSPSRSTNNKVLDQLRDLGYPYVSEFGEWINIGDNVGKANGYDTSKPYWTDAAKWVADRYSDLVSSYASGDLLLELKKAQLSQLELSRQNERKQLIEQFGQPMANLIRTYDDMQSRLPRLKPGQYSAVNEWRKKNAGKYFLLKRTYPKESLEGVNRARYGLDFRVDGLDPVNTTLDEASALFLSRWVQSHADEIDWWPIAVQHSTIPEKRPHFDPLVSTTEQSTNQLAKFGDAEMHLRVPAEKLIPYSILAQERINQLSREISSIEFSNENARNSEKYRQLNEEHSRLLRNISEYEFMIIGHIDMDEITKAPSDCSFCSVEVGKVAETGGTAIRNQDIIAARQAIEIANSHTYERPDLQHMVNAFAYASMGIASSQKSFFNLALRELNNAEKKFNSYEQTGQLLGGNTTIDLSSIDLNGVDPRLIALLSNLPENGSVTAQNPDQVRNTLQTARDYMMELGGNTQNISLLNPLVIQETVRGNAMRVMGDIKASVTKDNEIIDNSEEETFVPTEAIPPLDFSRKPITNPLQHIINNSTEIGFAMNIKGINLFNSYTSKVANWIRSNITLAQNKNLTPGATYINNRVSNSYYAQQLRNAYVQLELDITQLSDGMHNSGILEILESIKNTQKYQEIIQKINKLGDPELTFHLDNAIIQDISTLHPEKKISDELTLSKEDLLEATLLIDHVYLAQELLRGNTDPRYIFGVNAYQNWIQARKIASTDNSRSISIELIRAINNRINNSDTTNFRNGPIMGGDYAGNNTPIELAESQISAINKNKYLRWYPIADTGKFPQKGWIIYPTAEKIPNKNSYYFNTEELRGMLTPESFTRYLSEGETTESLVKNLLIDLLSWFNAEIIKENPDYIALAAEFQHRFVSIHPFRDGNGRTSRILMNKILTDHGLSPSIPYHPENDYFYSIEDWVGEVRKGINTYAMIENSLNEINFSEKPKLSEVVEKIKYKIFGNDWEIENKTRKAHKLQDLKYTQKENASTIEYILKYGGEFSEEILPPNTKVIKKGSTYQIITPDGLPFERISLFRLVNKIKHKLGFKVDNRFYSNNFRIVVYESQQISPKSDNFNTYIDKLTYELQIENATTLPLNHEVYGNKILSLSDMSDRKHEFEQQLFVSSERLSHFASFKPEAYSEFDKYFSDKKLYRGIKLASKTEPDDLVKYFTTITPENSSYRSLTSPTGINTQSVVSTLKDVNVMTQYVSNPTLASYLSRGVEQQELKIAAERRTSIKNKRSISKRIRKNDKYNNIIEYHRGNHLGIGHGRTDHDYNVSPFISTADNIDTALGYATNKLDEDRDWVKTRILFEFSRPKEGFRVTAGQTMLVGAIDPKSITRAYLLDNDGYIITIASKEYDKEKNQHYVEITNYHPPDPVRMVEQRLHPHLAITHYDELEVKSTRRFNIASNDNN